MTPVHHRLLSCHRQRGNTSIRIDSTTLAWLNVQVVKIDLMHFCPLATRTFQHLRYKQVHLPIFVWTTNNPTNLHDVTTSGNLNRCKSDVDTDLCISSRLGWCVLSNYRTSTRALKPRFYQLLLRVLVFGFQLYAHIQRAQSLDARERNRANENDYVESLIRKEG